MSKASKRLAALACLCFGLPAVPAKAIALPEPVPSLREFLSTKGGGHATLSPDGRYIALTLRGRLAVMETDTRRYVTTIPGGVWSYGWDGPNRIVALRYWSQATASNGDETAEMVRLDIDQDRIDTIGRATALLDTSPSRPGEALVLYRTDDKHPEQILRLDTQSGRTALVAQSPGALDTDKQERGTEFNYSIDRQGRLRYAWRTDFGTLAEGRLFIFRPGADGHPGDWERMPDEEASRFTPVFITADGRTTYFTLEQPTAQAGVSRFCLARQTTPAPATAPSATTLGAPSTLFCQERADLLTVLGAADGSEAIATLSEDGPPRVKLIADHPDADLLARFQASLKGDLVWPVSMSLDGRYWLLEASGSTNPGTYYLFDHRTQKLEELVRVAEDMPTGSLRPTRPLRFTARDGLPIDAYLTLPAPAADHRLPPLILVPHGGPIGIRDDGRYETETQILAAHGYAVLTVNFRGSGGYGLAFRKAGRGQYGTGMIDDLLAAVHDVLNRKLADPARVAVYGGSYGGYAALMCAIREPELFRAVVTMAGMTDLERMKANADAEHPEARAFMKLYVGEDAAALREQSPIHHLDRLKAPVMIAHGMQDTIVPVDQAQALRAALDKRHHPYEWMARGGAGHGFGNDREAMIDFYETMFAFLDRYVRDLQPPVATTTPIDPGGSFTPGWDQ